MTTYTQDHKNYYQKHKEKICKKQSEYYKLNKEKINKRDKIYNQNPEVKERKQHNNFIRNYGISLELYKNMVENQENKCTICDKNTKLVVDHCKKTGKVRSLLCDSCNKLIGFAYEDIEILKQAINYLETSKCL